MKNDIIIQPNDKTISEINGFIHLDLLGRLEIVDVSRNGIKVNGKKIKNKDKFQVRVNDKLSLGDNPGYLLIKKI
jgi:hypothetical protein